MNLNTEHDNWQEMAPKLAKVDKTNPFKVPEGYFDNLADRIQHRVEQKPKMKVIPLWARYAAAACLTLGLGLVLYLHLNQNKQNFADIPDHEIVAYLEVNLDEMDAEMVFEKLEKNSKTNIVQDFDQKELETYLNQTL
ncbi:MAG: hypothetical protein ACKOW2_03375 [Sphingobacteriaceae bacterium]